MTPRGLRARGRRFWSEVMDRYDLDPGEGQLLVEICRALDQVEALQAVVERVGVATASGDPTSAMVELRTNRALVARLIGQLALPGDDGRVLSLRSRHASVAAQRRHAMEARRRGHGSA